MLCCGDYAPKIRFFFTFNYPAADADADAGATEWMQLFHFVRENGFAWNADIKFMMHFFETLFWHRTKFMALDNGIILHRTFFLFVDFFIEIVGIVHFSEVSSCINCKVEWKIAFFGIAAKMNNKFSFWCTHKPFEPKKCKILFCYLLKREKERLDLLALSWFANKNN